MRSRLRCASVRGLRRTGCERFVAIGKKILQPEEVSGYLIYCFGDTLRFIEVIGGSSITATSRRKDNGGSIWSNLKNRRRFIRRESERQTESPNARLLRNPRVQRAVTGPPMA